MTDVIKNLMAACGNLQIAPSKPFATVQDFHAYILHRYPTFKVANKEQQLRWVVQAGRDAEEGRVPAAVQAIKNAVTLE
jgi:hypothetical protein